MTGAAVREITSAENARFRSLLKLNHSSRERRKAGLSLLDGVHLVAAYVQHVGAPEELVVSRSRLNDAEIAALLRSPLAPEPTVLSDALFRELSSVSTPTGILAVVKTPREPVLPQTPDACVVLEDLQDPGNLGSILRSAAAAGVKEMYMSKNCAQAWSPRVLRAGMGAHFVVSIHERVDLDQFVRSYPGEIVAVATDGLTPYYAADLRGRVALLFGNEGAGLSPSLRALASATVSIPMPGVAESLNVAAAAAICLFERVRQRAISVNQKSRAVTRDP